MFQQERGDFFSYDEGAFVLGFRDGMVWYLERDWGKKAAMPISEARDFAGRYIPEDRVMVEVFEPTTALLAEQYRSAWLAERYPNGAEGGDSGKPGDFIIQYQILNGRVEKFMINVGSQPIEDER